MDTTQSRTDPWWYLVGTGALLAVTTVAFFSTTGVWASLVVLAMIIVGIVFDRLTRRWRPRPATGRVRPAYVAVFVVSLLVILGVLVATWYLVTALGFVWVDWVAAVVLFLLVIASGRIADWVRSPS